jgi:hypothetical protein
MDSGDKSISNRLYMHPGFIYTTVRLVEGLGRPFVERSLSEPMSAAGRAARAVDDGPDRFALVSRVPS